jgi:hypothetical protein
MEKYITSVLNVFPSSILDKLSYDLTPEWFTGHLNSIYMYVGGLVNNASAIDSNGSSCSQYQK